MFILRDLCLCLCVLVCVCVYVYFGCVVAYVDCRYIYLDLIICVYWPTMGRLGFDYYWTVAGSGKMVVVVVVVAAADAANDVGAQLVDADSAAKTAEAVGDSVVSCGRCVFMWALRLFTLLKTLRAQMEKTEERVFAISTPHNMLGDSSTVETFKRASAAEKA